MQLKQYEMTISKKLSMERYILKHGLMVPQKKENHGLCVDTKNKMQQPATLLKHKKIWNQGSRFFYALIYLYLL